MERSTPLPRGAVRPADLVELSSRPGPFASVWTELSGTGSWGDAEDERRRKNAVTQLARSGAPEDLVAAVDEAFETVDPGARGAVIVADHEGRVVEALADPPGRELARCSPRPALSAILEHRQAAIPAVVVLADRLGADLAAGRSGGEMRELTVDGLDDPIRKTGQGGWSQARFQTRAEQTWEHNARGVADAVAQLADQVDPATILVGGDVRAVELIIDALPDALTPVVRRIQHGRADDSSGDLREDEIRTMLHNAAVEDTEAILDALASRSTHEGTAVIGPEATIAAIRQAQVDVLIVHDAPDDERVAYVSPESPLAISVGAEDLLTSGLGVAVPAGLVDAAICSVLQSGGSVRVVPETAILDGGIGALLRWETTAAG